jgi:hypothetical protein
VVQDLVSRWTDTAFQGPTGRIIGEAVDNSSGQPIPDLLITAGGMQTVSASDGSFILEGLLPGVHNLVGYAMDGSHRSFQQGALVAADSSTPAPIRLNPSPLVHVTFIATLPEGTPPVVPVRIAGIPLQTCPVE